MSEDIHKSHNVSRLMYHFVLPTKYRRVVVDDKVERVIKETCEEISKRFEIYFLEIGCAQLRVWNSVGESPTV